MKTLEQIQQENRERIAKAQDLRGMLPIINYDVYKEPLTLNRVLIALKGVNTGKTENILGIDCYGVIWNSGTHQEYCEWNLNKETLEDQEESVQREVNKLLGD